MKRVAAATPIIAILLLGCDQRVQPDTSPIGSAEIAVSIVPAPLSAGWATYYDAVGVLF